MHTQDTAAIPAAEAVPEKGPVRQQDLDASAMLSCKDVGVRELAHSFIQGVVHGHGCFRLSARMASVDATAGAFATALVLEDAAAAAQRRAQAHMRHK